jgi:pimeloyl-[acyl-carrier protein] synthase
VAPARTPEPPSSRTADYAADRAGDWARCRRALSSAELVSDARLAGLEPTQPNNLLFMDGEPHQRLRALVMPYFTSRRLAGIAARLERSCKLLVETALAEPTSDLLADVAEPFVLDAILSAMAVPDARREQLGALARDMLGLLELDQPPAARRRAANAALRATMLFERDRRRGEATGLHAALEAAVQEGAIAAKLARSTPVVVLHGGYENPLNQLGCVIASAVEDPERFKDAAATDAAVLFEEVMRMFSPVRLLARWAATDLEEDGSKRGDLVWVDLERANRGSRFSSELDLSRRQPHLGFGYGAHACIGTALARIEGRALIGALSEVPLSQLGEFVVTWRDGVITRGPASILR